MHKNADVQSVIAHEVSHSIGETLDLDKLLNKALDEFTQTKEYKDLMANDIMAKYLPPWQVAAGDISKLATTTEKELWAEALECNFNFFCGQSYCGYDIIKLLQLGILLMARAILW